jgi:hypothetical protein
LLHKVLTPGKVKKEIGSFLSPIEHIPFELFASNYSSQRLNKTRAGKNMDTIYRLEESASVSSWLDGDDSEVHTEEACHSPAGFNSHIFDQLSLEDEDKVKARAAEKAAAEEKAEAAIKIQTSIRVMLAKGMLASKKAPAALTGSANERLINMQHMQILNETSSPTTTNKTSAKLLYSGLGIFAMSGVTFLAMPQMAAIPMVVTALGSAIVALPYIPMGLLGLGVLLLVISAITVWQEYNTEETAIESKKPKCK